MANTLKSTASKRKTAKGISEGYEKRLAQSEAPLAVPTLSTPSIAQPSATVGNVGYSSIDQISHGLNFPCFDPNTHLANDLFTDSSNLARTTKAEADAACESIEEKRQTIRVARANMALNSDIVDAGTDQRKFEGKVISYATEQVKNEQKFVNFNTELVNRDIAVSRYNQTSERLVHNNITLSGLQGQTPHLRDEWQARIQLSISKVHDVRIAALRAEDRVKTERASLSVQQQELLD